MTVFKAFLKIFKKYKVMILINLALLGIMAAFNLQSDSSVQGFMEKKASIYLVNEDDGKLASDLSEYLEKKCTPFDVGEGEDALDDAFFMRFVNYSLIIPKGFSEDFMAGKEPRIETRMTGDYYSSLADLHLRKYLTTASGYLEMSKSQEELIDHIHRALSLETEVDFLEGGEEKDYNKPAAFFNFLNYTLLAGNIYAIGMVLLSFREEKVRMRTMVSSMSYRKFNGILLLGNMLLSVIVWLVYLLIGSVLLRDYLMDGHMLIFVLNSFVFNLCAVALSFLLANIVDKKEAITGWTNIISLGSSFLVGAFVPVEFLPEFVKKIGMVLPSYYYVRANNMTRNLATLNLETLGPVFWNLGIVLLYTVGFVLLANLFAKKNRTLA